MTKQIQAIETIYRGYRFRRRLEARWAVYFDLMNIPWEYEFEGYRLSTGENYLPDFYLPEVSVAVEIKPIGDFTINFPEQDIVNFKDGRKNASKYNTAAQDLGDAGRYIIFMGDPFNVFGREQVNGKRYFFTKGSCILREERYCGENCNECIRKDEMICYQMFVLSENKIIPIVKTSDLFMMPKNTDNFGVVAIDDNKAPNYYNVDVSEFQNIRKKGLWAAAKARQARFEHGEHGI